MKQIVLHLFVLVLVFTAAQGTALAQKENAVSQIEKDLELVRRDLRSEKKKIIAMNVPLTATEATTFWPVYDSYAQSMAKHYDEFLSVIKDYAANQNTLTDAQALSMVKRWSDFQVRLAETRKKFVPQFEKVVAGKKAALFFQIDRRLYALMDLQIASEVPLVLQ